MSDKLRQFLFDSYETHRQHLPKKAAKNTILQIDDQDDNDSLTEFCTVFVRVTKSNSFEIELSGAIPVSEEIADLAEIYQGHADRANGTISMNLTINQIDVLIDLASKLKKTVFKGKSVNNPNWHRISARTISTLHRFVRTVKEYERLAGRLF